MFQRARMRCRPLGKPLIVCEKVAAGCDAFPSIVALSAPSTKYSQFSVRWHAVQVQLNVIVLPTFCTGQARPLLSNIGNRPPPLHAIEPLGASTLCGSYWTSPQSNPAVCLAHSS